MVYVSLQVQPLEDHVRESAEQSLRDAGWSPEEWHRKNRGRLALRRGVRLVAKQRRELPPVSPPPNVDLEAQKRLAVRRCCRKVQKALRDLDASRAGPQRGGGRSEAGLLAELRRRTRKLGLAMAADPPPAEAYSTHRAWLARTIEEEEVEMTDYMEALNTPTTPGTTQKHNRIVDLLRQVPMLNALTKYDLVSLAKAVVPVTFSLGEVLMREGDTDCDTMYIVANGEAAVTSERRGFLASKRRGEAVGEMAIMHDAPRNATVIAHKGDVECYELSRDAFDSYVFGHLQEQRRLTQPGSPLRTTSSVLVTRTVLANTEEPQPDAYAQWTQPLMTRAAAHARMGQFDAALCDVVEVLKIQPKHAEAL